MSVPAPMVFLSAEHVKIKGYSASGRGKATVVKIEFSVEDGWELGSILRQIQECQNWRPAPPPKPTTVRVKRPGHPPEELLYLPAPAPRLTFQGE